MKFTPIGKIVLLLLALGIAVGGWRLWSGGSGKGGAPFGFSLGGGGGAGGSQGVLGRPLRVALNYWPGFAGGVQANGGFKANKNSTFWTKNQLQVEFIDIEAPDQMTKALTAGAPEGVDVMWQTTDTWPTTDANLRKAGINAKAFLQADWSQGGDAIVASSEIRRVEDLVGKRIGLVTLSPSHSLLEESLRDSSLDDAQRKRIETGLKAFDDPATIVKAFRAGQLDVAVTWEPNVTEALKRSGAHVLLSSATANKVIGDIFVAKSDFIAKHPDAIKAFVSGWLDGATEVNAKPSSAIPLLMASMPPFKEAGEAVTQDTLSKVRIATLSDNNELFGLDGKPALFDKIYDRFARVYFEIGAIPNMPQAQTARDSTGLAQLYAANPVPKPAPATFKQIRNPAKVKPAVVTRRLTIHFPSGSDQIAPESASALGELRGLAERLSNAYLRIEGNTDNVGSRATNIQLSKQRAQSVANYLVKQGFDRNRFIVVGNGPEKPVASNATEAGRAQNRRTDIKVSPK
jgi:NitT/TauT family transport system substrate-binding protein